MTPPDRAEAGGDAPATRRTAFYVSDRTGITAEMFGRSLLTQFEGLDIEERTFPFVDTEGKAREIAARIDRVASERGTRPLVFGTLVDRGLSAIIGGSSCLFINFFDAFIGDLEREIGRGASRQTGTSHSIRGFDSYQRRIDAINFTIAHDDGADVSRLERADIVLVGISRCGKTPTCLYLAIHFGIFAANYPLVPEDLGRKGLPEVLESHARTLYGLTILPSRLAQIREQRRPRSAYADIGNCEREIRAAERLLRAASVPVIDVTHRSVEEISAKILQDTRLRRHIY